MAGCYAKTTEFKRLKCPLKDLEKPLIERVSEFVIACMNGRVNGTISLGVEDNGEIVGLCFPISDCNEVSTIYDRNFCNKDPKLFYRAKEVASVVHQCILGPIFIPLSNDPSRCVVEFDVMPSTSLCGTSIFFIKIRLTTTPEKKRETTPQTTPEKSGKKKKAERFFWIRRGTVSQFIEDDEGPKIEALERDVKRNAIEREMVDMEYDVRRSSPTNPNLLLEIQLRKLVLRRRARIVDDELSYCLVLDSLTSSHQEFSWIGSIRWNFVLDLHQNYEFFDKVYYDEKYASTGEMVPKRMTFMQLKRFEEEYQSREDIRDAIEFTQKTTWVQATRADLNSIDWHTEAKHTLFEAMSTFTEEAAVSSKQNLVFIIVIDSNKNLSEIATLLNDAKSIVKHPEQFALLFGSEELKKAFKQEVKKFFREEEFIEQSLVIKNWDFLNNFMLTKQNSKYTMQGLRIPGNETYPHGVQIPSNIWKMLKSAGIDILALNQCEDLPKAMEKDDYVKKGSKIIKDFFKGGQASYELFHFSECQNKGWLLFLFINFDKIYLSLTLSQ